MNRLDRTFSRRRFLAGSGLAAAGSLAGASLFGRLVALGAIPSATLTRYLGASDGFIQLPGWTSRPGAPAEGMYVFGFREVFDPVARTVSINDTGDGTGGVAEVLTGPGTADLAKGMPVQLDGVPGRTIASIVDATHFSLSSAASSGLATAAFAGGLTSTTFQRVATATVKGRIQMPAPYLSLPPTYQVRLLLANTGFLSRPDLADSHTIHWHGFRNNIAVYDGVPEMSLSVLPGKNAPYFYITRDPGTYMYHCHFEDVEHVQMGMQGMVTIEGPTVSGQRYAYAVDNTVDPLVGLDGTQFEREFSIMLDEIWSTGHNNDLRIQASVWNDYEPDYFVMNGRAYPDTILPNDDPSLPNQPVSSLVQAYPGERVLLRVASLGYQQHALRLDGIDLTLVAIDATPLRIRRRISAITLGPGEGRDVIFTAPSYDPAAPYHEDELGPYNLYYLENSERSKVYNPGLPGRGGMATEVRIYANPIPAQTKPNVTLRKAR